MRIFESTTMSDSVNFCADIEGLRDLTHRMADATAQIVGSQTSCVLRVPRADVEEEAMSDFINACVTSHQTGRQVRSRIRMVITDSPAILFRPDGTMVQGNMQYVWSPNFRSDKIWLAGETGTGFWTVPVAEIASGATDIRLNTENIEDGSVRTKSIRRAGLPCANCGEAKADMHECARCTLVVYCSRECEREHSIEHANACEPPFP